MRSVAATRTAIGVASWAIAHSAGTASSAAADTSPPS